MQIQTVAWRVHTRRRNDMLHGGRAQGSGGKRSSSRGAARLLETYLAPDSGLLEGLASARFTAGIGVGPPLKRHARAAAAEMSKLVRAAMEAQGGEGGSARPLAYGRLFYLLEVEELLPSDILSIAKVVTVGLHRTGAELASCSPWQVDRPFLARVVPAVASLAWRLLDALKDRANLARIYSSFDLYACLTLLGQLRMDCSKCTSPLLPRHGPQGGLCAPPTVTNTGKQTASTRRWAGRPSAVPPFTARASTTRS